MGDPVLPDDPGSLSSAERISDRQVPLAAGDLSCMSPERSAVDDAGIVNPLGDFVGDHRRTVKGGQEHTN